MAIYSGSRIAFGRTNEGVTARAACEFHNPPDDRVPERRPAARADRKVQKLLLVERFAGKRVERNL